MGPIFVAMSSTVEMLSPVTKVYRLSMCWLFRGDSLSCCCLGPITALVKLCAALRSAQPGFIIAEGRMLMMSTEAGYCERGNLGVCREKGQAAGYSVVFNIRRGLPK